MPLFIANFEPSAQRYYRRRRPFLPLFCHPLEAFGLARIFSGIVFSTPAIVMTVSLSQEPGTRQSLLGPLDPAR